MVLFDYLLRIRRLVLPLVVIIWYISILSKQQISVMLIAVFVGNCVKVDHFTAIVVEVAGRAGRVGQVKYWAVFQAIY
jgi:hypothetical protein